MHEGGGEKLSGAGNILAYEFTGVSGVATPDYRVWYTTQAGSYDLYLASGIDNDCLIYVKSCDTTLSGTVTVRPQGDFLFGDGSESVEINGLESHSFVFLETTGLWWQL